MSSFLWLHFSGLPFIFNFQQYDQKVTRYGVFFVFWSRACWGRICWAAWICELIFQEIILLMNKKRLLYHFLFHSSSVSQLYLCYNISYCITDLGFFICFPFPILFFPSFFQCWYLICVRFLQPFRQLCLASIMPTWWILPFWYIFHSNRHKSFHDLAVEILHLSCMMSTTL